MAQDVTTFGNDSGAKPYFLGYNNVCVKNNSYDSPYVNNLGCPSLDAILPRKLNLIESFDLKYNSNDAAPNEPLNNNSLVMYAGNFQLFLYIIEIFFLDHLKIKYS